MSSSCAMSGLSSRNVVGRISENDPESLVPNDDNNLVGRGGSSCSDSTRKDNQVTPTVVLLVVGWYLCAIACITSSKRVLLDCPFPCLLCLAQFTVSAGAVRLLRLSGILPKPPSRTSQPLGKDDKILLRRLMTVIGVSYCAGFFFTNLSFSLVSANFAETIKSGEPISSVLLGYVVLRQTYSPFSYACLVVICLGVGLSCVGADDFSLWGFVFAVISNFCFSYRAVLAKQLGVQFPGEVDEITLFARIAATGCALMLPLTLLLEGRGVIALLLAEDRGSGFLPAPALLLLLFGNGLTYCAYNVLSFFVLYRTDIMLHAVLNVCRRMTIIVFTACFFQVHVSPLNAGGIVLALLGVLLFSTRR